MNFISQYLPPNRIAVIVSVLVAVATLIAAAAEAFPGEANKFAAAAALISQAVTVFKFLEGSQRHEERVALGVDHSDYEDFEPETTEYDTAEDPDATDEDEELTAEEAAELYGDDDDDVDNKPVQ